MTTSHLEHRILLPPTSAPLRRLGMEGGVGGGGLAPWNGREPSTPEGMQNLGQQLPHLPGRPLSKCAKPPEAAGSRNARPRRA